MRRDFVDVVFYHMFEGGLDRDDEVFPVGRLEGLRRDGRERNELFIGVVMVEEEFLICPL